MEIYFSNMDQRFLKYYYTNIVALWLVFVFVYSLVAVLFAV